MLPEGENRFSAPDNLSRKAGSGTEPSSFEPSAAREVSAETRPKVKWKITPEKTPTTDRQRRVVEERRTWLSYVFDEQDPSPERAAVLTAMRQAVRGPNKASTQALFDRRFPDRRQQERAFALARRYEKGNVSLLNLLNEANTPDDLHSLKIFSTLLLGPYTKQRDSSFWQDLPEDQKRLVRLGELLGLEIERRIAYETIDTMKLSSLGPISDRYRKLAHSPDVPDIFQDRFAAFSERLAERPGFEPRSLREGDVLPFPKVSTPAESDRISIPSKAQDQEKMFREIQAGRRELLADDPEARKFMKEIYADEMDYNPEFIQLLKDVKLTSPRVDDMYRQNFLDTLAEQMRYANYVNDKPAGLNLLLRYIPDSLSSRFAVLGVRGSFKALFRWRWARQTMEKVRYDVMETFGQLGKYRPEYTNLAMIHATDLLMTTLSERRIRRARKQTRATKVGSAKLSSPGSKKPAKRRAA